MADAMIWNTDRLKPIFPNVFSVGLQMSVVYDLKLIRKISTKSLILLENPFYKKEFSGWRNGQCHLRGRYGKGKGKALP